MRRAVLGMGLVLLAGCADDRSAGNSIETENSVAARVLRLDSIVGATSTKTGNSAAVVTLRLNSLNFPFARSSADGRDLRIETSSGEAIPFRIVFWDSAANVARVQVRLDSGVLASLQGIRLRWGVHQTKPLSDSAATWSGFTASQMSMLTTTLVDDFEDGDDITSLPWKYPWRSSLSARNASLSWSIEGAGHGRSGNALRARFTADSVNSWVLVGVPFGPGHHVFRSLDSIVLQARGKGVLTVALEHLDGALGPKTWKSIILDTAWKRIRLRPSDFDSADGVGQNLGWERVRDSVTDITFFGWSGSEFQIDNILLHGIVPDDLK